jgi:NADH:ubiquinone oxidoreductase subunit H
MLSISYEGLSSLVVVGMKMSNGSMQGVEAVKMCYIYLELQSPQFVTKGKVGA